VPQNGQLPVYGCFTDRFQARDAKLQNLRSFDFAKLRFPEKSSEALYEPRLAIVAFLVDADGFEVRLGNSLNVGDA